MKHRKSFIMTLFLLVGVFTFAACNNSSDEKEETNNQPETDIIETTSETEISLWESEYNGFVVNPESLVLDTERTDLFENGKNPYYDKENGCIVFFVTEEIAYSTSDLCDLVISSENDIFILDGTLVTDQYPSLKTENGYLGAAIKFDETLIPANYRFSINFSVYTIGFTCTIE